MWKMILGQSVYQLVVILVLNFSGKQILGLDSPSDEATRIQFDDEHKTLVFNAFVFCQIFNQFNARVLDRSFNVFHGIQRNYYFMVIFLTMLGGQVSAHKSLLRCKVNTGTDESSFFFFLI
jgi:Ca2+-transporting ATPase